MYILMLFIDHWPGRLILFHHLILTMATMSIHLPIPNAGLRLHLLREWGGTRPRRPLFPKFPTKITLERSKKPMRSEILELVRRAPFLDPVAAQKQDEMLQELASSDVHIQTIQYGWDCRDGVFSVEWEQQASAVSKLVFDGDNRQMQILLHEDIEHRES